MEYLRLTKTYLSTKLKEGRYVETSIQNRGVFEPAWSNPTGPNPEAMKAMKSMLQAKYVMHVNRVEKLRVNLSTAYRLVL